MEIKFKDAICTVYNAHRLPGDIVLLYISLSIWMVIWFRNWNLDQFLRGRET